MTREEAIKILEQRFDSSCRNNLFQNAEKLDYEDALWMAISALRSVSREQVEKVWRGEWIDTRESSKDVPTCMCSRCTRVVVGLESKFCPDCGSPMTDEAVEMVMERLEALKDGSTTD